MGADDSAGGGPPSWARWAPVAVAVAAVAGTATVALALRRRRRATAAAAAAQRALESESKRASPRGDGLFAGLRVVDMATHVAAPSAARCLADLGAEVIKVESPGGDLLRNVLVVFEQPRAHGTTYETQNLGKACAQLDLKEAGDKARLLALLGSADVVITNTRQAALDKLGFDFASLHARFPQLVYAQVSAWGLRGEDAGLPGYDVGAFWTATGLAALVNKAGAHSTYPGALGDQTTAQFLLAGIEMALFQRLRSGRGSFVHASLLHAGAWCIAPHVLDAAAPPVPAGAAPDYAATLAAQARVVNNVYDTADGRPVALSFCGPLAAEADAEARLARALGVPPPPAGTSAGTSAGKANAQWPAAGDVRAAVKGMGVEAVTAALAGEREFGLRATAYVDIKERWAELREREGERDLGGAGAVVPSPPGYDDVPFVPRLPYDFSSFAAPGVHTPSSRAPTKGEHTRCVLERGWLSPDARPFFPEHVGEPGSEAASSSSSSSSSPSSSPTPVGLASALEGLVVVELSDPARGDVAVAGAGKLLAEAGATVFHCPAATLAGASVDEAVRAHYHGGKRPVDDAAAAVATHKAALVLTDLGDEALALALPDATATAHVVVVQLVPRASKGREKATEAAEAGAGAEAKAAEAEAEAVEAEAEAVEAEAEAVEAEAEAEGFTALESMFLNNGMGNVMGGTPAREVPVFPRHCLENIAAVFMVAGGMAALLHARRTTTATATATTTNNSTHKKSGSSTKSGSGRGQRVRVAYERVGLWMAQLNSIFVLRNPDMHVIVAKNNEREVPHGSPLPCYSSHVLSDGQWVQLLGLDTKRHLPKVLGALGIKLRVYAGIARAVLFGVLPNRKEKNLFLRLEPVLVAINSALERALRTVSFRQLNDEPRFKDVWFAPVRVPCQLRDYKQAIENGVVVRRQDGTVAVPSPLAY